jgi:cullin-4
MATKEAPKKLVIKPFKSQPKLPDNYEELAWSRLKAAVDAVFRKTSVSVSKEELYQVWDMA